MFRNIYVCTFSGTPVDFHRASLLMDKQLLQQAIEAMERDGSRCLKCGEQWIWGYYCQRHREKYGEPFGPNVTPGWDVPPEPEREPMSAADRERMIKKIVMLNRDADSDRSEGLVANLRRIRIKQ